MFMTHEMAIRNALQATMRNRCATGQHVRGCPHRTNEPVNVEIDRHSIRPRIFEAF
jgi:hypothetical protein